MLETRNATTALRRLRCVLVDDDPHFLKLAAAILARARLQIEVHEFLSAIPALDYFRREPADLIITDVRMPLMNGLQFTAAIRELDARVPIVVMSSDDLAREALAHGANVFVTKCGIAASLGATIARLGIRAEVENATSAPANPPAPRP